MPIQNGVIGTDGKYPIVDDEPLWRMWSINQIWKGTVGENRYVPKVKDWVVDPDIGDTWIVDHIDPVSLIPTLRPIFFKQPDGGLTSRDILIGSGPGSPSETYRAYLNDSVFPHTLSIDSALHVYGTMSSYCRIFLGTDTSEETGKIISKVYDASGNFISDMVPLELAALDSHTNYAVKAIKRCHVTEKFPTGELITVVIYADDGHVVYKRPLLIENTDTIADAFSTTKYISDISLESIWLSSNTADLIEYPLNIPMNSLNMVGRVLYSDGSVAEYPVGGPKFTMLGLDGRLSSIIGQPADLVLRYTLGQNEIAYASTGENGRYITKPFKIITVNPNNSIAVKLFVYPEWKSPELGYHLRWFLLNLERNVKFEVTGMVNLAENTGPFDPKLYDYVQKKAVTINLRDVSGSFIPYIHTQVVEIVLKGPPSADAMPSWTVVSEASEANPVYGTGVYAKREGLGISIKGSFESLDDWLEGFYWNTLPLHNPHSENKAPRPTHFVVSYGAEEREFPITDWETVISYPVPPSIGSNVYIRFIRRTATNDMQLAYAAAMVKSF